MLHPTIELSLASFVNMHKSLVASRQAACKSGTDSRLHFPPNTFYTSVDAKFPSLIPFFLWSSKQRTLCGSPIATIVAESIFSACTPTVDTSHFLFTHPHHLPFLHQRITCPTEAAVIPVLQLPWTLSAPAGQYFLPITRCWGCREEHTINYSPTLTKISAITPW